MGGGRRRWILLGLLALAGTAAIAWLAGAEFESLERGDRMHLVYGSLLTVVLLSGLIVHLRRRPALALTQAALWVAIGLVLILGYSFRFEAASLWDRIAGELSPARGTQPMSNAIRFRAARDGHFHIDGAVDNVPVRFLVDTGASLLVLSPEDARRVGFDVTTLDFSLRTRTANGVGQAAPVWLREVRVGPIIVNGVRAAVNRAPMNQSLLGVSFLEKLTRYEVRDGTLTLER